LRKLTRPAPSTTATCGPLDRNISAAAGTWTRLLLWAKAHIDIHSGTEPGPC
jgi:hypothetical protein